MERSGKRILTSELRHEEKKGGAPHDTSAILVELLESVKLSLFLCHEGFLTEMNEELREWQE